MEDSKNSTGSKLQDWTFPPVPARRDGIRVTLTPSVPQLAAKGLVDQLEMLLEEGAEVDEESPNGSSALTLAAKYGQLESVRVLLRHGAKTKHTALLAAIEAGHEEIVRCLSLQASVQA